MTDKPNAAPPTLPKAPADEPTTLARATLTDLPGPASAPFEDQDPGLMFGDDADDHPQGTEDQPGADASLVPAPANPKPASVAGQPRPTPPSTPTDTAEPPAIPITSPSPVHAPKPEKEPLSPKVVNIITNTPHGHARDQDPEAPKPQEGLDWEAIGQDYAAGVLSVRAIAKVYGCRDSTILRHAARYGWTRNLTQRVQQRAQAELLLGGNLSNEGENGSKDEGEAHAQTQIIEKAASIQVQVVQAHRKDLAKLRSLQAQLIKQAELFFAVTGKKKDLIVGLSELQTAVQVVESLARTVSRVIPLERAAFNIDAKQGPATEAQAIERRVQVAADRKKASPEDPQAVQRATRALNDARRKAKIEGKGKPGPIGKGRPGSPLS